MIYSCTQLAILYVFSCDHVLISYSGYSALWLTIVNNHNINSQNPCCGLLKTLKRDVLSLEKKKIENKNKRNNCSDSWIGFNKVLSF